MMHKVEKTYEAENAAASNSSGGEEDEAAVSLMGLESKVRPLWMIASDAHVWQKVAGVSGVAALALGTYGAHVFKPKNIAYKDVWATANLYHLTHTAALLAAPLTRRPHLFGGLLTFGIVAFSGSCYLAALMEDKKYSVPAPFGGFAFMGAWASLLF